LSKLQKIYDTNYNTLNLLHNTTTLSIRKNIGCYFIKNGKYFRNKFSISNLVCGDWDYSIDKDNKSFEFHSIVNNKFTKTSKINITRNCYEFDYMLISQSRNDYIMDYDAETLCAENDCVVRYDSDILLKIYKTSRIKMTLLMIDNDEITGIKIEYGLPENKTYCNENKCEKECFNINVKQTMRNEKEKQEYPGMKHITRNTNKLATDNRNIRKESIEKANAMIESDKRKKIIEQLIISEELRDISRVNLEAFILDYETKINKDKMKEINKETKINNEKIKNTDNVFNNNYKIDKIIINSKNGKIMDIVKIKL
jgi:hypothetical protein